MNHWIGSLVGLLLFLSLVGCTAYGQLKAEWDDHEPPPIARAVANTPHEANLEVETAPELSSPPDLNAMKERWSESAESPTTLAPKMGVSMDTLAIVAGTAASVSLFERPWSLKIAKAAVVLRNPGVKAADERLRAAIETIGQVTALDAILSQYTSFTQAQMTAIGPMKGADPVQMKFPFPGVTGLKGRVAEANIRIAAENRRAVYRDAVSNIQTAYHTLVFARQARSITGETLRLLKHLEEVATTRYKAGKTSYQDVTKVRIRRQTLAEELVTWQHRQKAEEARIRALLNLPPELVIARPVVATPIRSVPDAEVLIPMAMAKRPELRRLRAQLDKMDSMIRMAETMIQPTMAHNLSRFDNRPVQTTGNDATRSSFPLTTTVQRGAGLPKMPWYGSEDAYLRETRRKQLALAEELANAEAQTRFRVVELWQRLDQAVREEKLYRQSVVELSETALTVSTREYEAGRIPFAEVIASHIQWLNSRLALARAQSAIGEARARLLRIIGARWPSKA